MPASEHPLQATAQPKTSLGESRWAVYFAAFALVLAAFCVYSNTFSAPFLLDDGPAIVDNPTIRHLATALSPPLRTTAGGRPLLNLSFAFNYALGGMTPKGFHALNLVIHVFAGLTLFGLLRRTLLQPRLKERMESRHVLPFAFVVAALWALHPLQTESVTYIVQRAESMMGLFYLLTLYFFIHGVQSNTPIRWQVASVLACLLGTVSKEVIVSAPVITFLYDRTFVADSFSETWKKRWPFYLSLGATWIVLGYSVLSAGGNRGGSAGFDVGTNGWAYYLTQFRAVTNYLSLSVWPRPLIFEYGTEWVTGAAQVAPHALIVFALLVGTAVSLWRWPVIGFIGAWFFAMLAPTSLVPGTTQMIVEHRMYLSLAAVIVLEAIVLYSVWGRKGLLVLLMLAVGMGVLTHRRNEDYASELAIWSDTVAKRPSNALAYNNLGFSLQRSGRNDEALARYQQALQLRPDYVEAHNNIGAACFLAGRFSESIVHYEAALRLSPDNVETHNGLGTALFRAGQQQDAIAHYERALRLKPDYAEAHNNLGNVLLLTGHASEAIGHYEEAVRLKPDYQQARNNLARARAVGGGRANR